MPLVMSTPKEPGGVGAGPGVIKQFGGKGRVEKRKTTPRLNETYLCCECIHRLLGPRSDEGAEEVRVERFYVVE